MSPISIPDYPATEQALPLPPRGPWPQAVHHFTPDQVAALRAAEAAGRPLLVRGLPGVGKSQLARAAAVAAGRRFAWMVIHGRTEAQDLMWQFDAVQRLSDAQAQKALGADAYVSPGPLWAAFDWDGAAKKFGAASPRWMDATPGGEGMKRSDEKVVLLLDEIDKADPDLPNALLEALNGDGFHVPHQKDGQVVCKPGQRPLIILTTNEERELPPAFLRRCFVITLELPKGEEELKSHLISLAKSHLEACQQSCSPTVLTQAAQALWHARLDAQGQQGVPPATAEFLDLVRALVTLYPEQDEAQLGALALLSQYALVKGRAGA